MAMADDQLQPKRPKRPARADARALRPTSHEHQQQDPPDIVSEQGQGQSMDTVQSRAAAWQEHTPRRKRQNYSDDEEDTTAAGTSHVQEHKRARQQQQQQQLESAGYPRDTERMQDTGNRVEVAPGRRSGIMLVFSERARELLEEQVGERHWRPRFGDG